MMYTNLYVYKAPPRYMTGKLYWRLKKNDKWTWVPVNLKSFEFWDFLDSLGLSLWDIETKIVEEE